MELQLQLVRPLRIRMSVVVIMVFVQMTVRLMPVQMGPVIMPEEETFVRTHSERGEDAGDQNRKNAEWWLHGDAG